MNSANASEKNDCLVSALLPFRYLSLCFALVAKEIQQLELQRTVTRRQAGRKDREVVLDVDVGILFEVLCIGEFSKSR